MNPLKKLKLSLDIISVLTFIKDDAHPEENEEKLRSVLREAALSGSGLLLSVWTVNAQKNDAIRQTLKAIEWIEREFANEFATKDSVKLDLSKFMCFKSYLIGLHSPQVDDTRYETMVNSIMSSEYVPTSPKLRAAILGSLSMGYAMRGNIKQSYQFMNKAIENNPDQLSVEKKALPLIHSQPIRTAWQAHIAAMDNAVAPKAPMRMR